MFESVLGLRKGDTFGAVLARNRGIGPGFDVLRIALALLIMIGHAKWLAGGHSLGAEFPTVADSLMAGAPGAPRNWVGWTRPLKLALVPAFFALSGFLVTGSALRLRRVPTFLAHRGLRIFPALVVEVLLSAFVLGAFFTTLPLASYFRHPMMHRYLLNMVGEVSFRLPGVFEHNAATAMVNANLWTLPAELVCYVVATLMMLTGVMYDRRRVLAVTVAATLVLATLHYLYGISASSAYYPSHVIVYYFLLGATIYHWRDYMPTSPWLVLPVCILTYLLLMVDALIYVVPPLLAWASLWIGMIAFPRFRLLASGDYSYGIYLYGFPLTQALITLVPGFYGHPLLFTLAAVALTCLFAAFSWHVVEKRVLRLRHLLPERWFPSAPVERIAVETAVVSS